MNTKYAASLKVQYIPQGKEYTYETEGALVDVEAWVKCQTRRFLQDGAFGVTTVIGPVNVDKFY